MIRTAGISLTALLRESSASEEAHKLGLTHKGYGYWANAQGVVVAKTVDDQLVRVDDKEPAKDRRAKPDSETPEQTAQRILAKKIGGQAGSNEGGFYEGSDGVKRYVKKYIDPTRGESEALTNDIYRDLDLGAPTSTVFRLGGKTLFASDIIPGDTLNHVPLTKELANRILDGFAADVLTANWDAIGLVDDNILVGEDGTPYRIDNGGALLFRAQEASGRKPETLLDKITEWDVFPTKNASYAKIFQIAGYKSPDDMGMKVIRQIVDIAKFAQGIGSWQEYVDKKMPEMDEHDRADIARMLDARTKLLLKKAMEIKEKLS